MLTQDKAYEYNSIMGLTGDLSIMKVTSANLAITRAGVEPEDVETTYHIGGFRPFREVVSYLNYLDFTFNNAISKALQYCRANNLDAHYSSSWDNSRIIITSRINQKRLKELTDLLGITVRKY